MPLMAAAMLAGHLAVSPAYAAEFGHSRLVSSVGEPLRITIPVTELSAAEAESLRIIPAPASEWLNAGLTPPVDPATLQARLADGYAPGARVIQVWSDQVFNRPIADLLLDIHTASGVERYQVSLLARGGTTAVQAPVTSSATGTTTQSAARQHDIIDQAPVLVRRGETMFSVARRHAVSGVTVYQMMMALQRANPDAFIHQNVNLVKAGSRLVMPDIDALTAISDREARRLFHEQVVAFNAYRQGHDGPAAGDIQPGQGAMADDASDEPLQAVSNIPDSLNPAGDQLKLSSGSHAVTAASATQAAIDEGSATATSSGEPPASASESSLVQNMAAGVSSTAHAANAGIPVDAPGSVESASASGSQGAAAGAGGLAPSGKAAASQGVSPATVSNGPELTGDGSAADDALASRKALDDAEARVSILEENVKNLNRALQSQGEAAIDVVVDGAIGLRQSLTEMATAVTEATIGDDDFLDDPAATQNGDKTTPKTLDNSQTGMIESIATWVHANFIGVLAGVLALIVVLIAWALRRANVAHSRSESAVTPEMVKEKLNEINLDLNDPTVGDSARRS